MKNIIGLFTRLFVSVKRVELFLTGLTTLLLAAGAVVIMIPLIFMISTSLKDPAQLRSDANTLIPRKPQTASINGEDYPLYQVKIAGNSGELALIKKIPLTLEKHCGHEILFAGLRTVAESIFHLQPTE